ncbi:MAG: hypothetical protein WC907_08345, partial [Acholeplasmataceae bacterium]
YKALYGHLQELVQQSENVMGIRLYAAKTNVNALETYRKLGMTDQHYVTFEWLKDPDTFKPQT